MCCHPFFKTRIPIVEKGERGKNVKTFWIGNNTTGSILNMKAECSMNVIQWNTYTSTGWGCCLFLGFGLRFQFIRQTTSTVFTSFLLLWTITTGCWSDKKKPITTYELKTVNVYYSFTLASINYVYMYLTLSTIACLWNQLFMETQFKKKKSLYYMYLVLTADFIKKNYHSVYLIQVQYIIMYNISPTNKLKKLYLWVMRDLASWGRLHPTKHHHLPTPLHHPTCRMLTRSTPWLPPLVIYPLSEK